ncbi:MAG: hypothetical protein Q7S45_02535 [Candidatus Curtissbacteria bacterium]|nr:hypothetical protein [Candidatus Curtissbacteria bacterium]
MDETNRLQESRRIALPLAIVIGIILLISMVIIFGVLNKKSPPPGSQTREKVILNLPRLTADYSIVYGERTDHIYINLINEPYDQNYQKAIKWLKDQGADIEELNIQVTPEQALDN